jgi:hypothetical protein
MASDEGVGRRQDRWAHLRFAVIGALLAAPPTKGALQTPSRNRGTPVISNCLRDDAKGDETSFACGVNQLDEVIARREWRQRQLGRDP